MAKPATLLDRRLKALLSLLYWEGEVRNKRVRALFGLATLQASRLLRTFREQHSDLIEETGTGYRLAASVPGKSTSIDEYLRAVADAGDSTEWLVDARHDFLDPPPHVFAILRRACLEAAGIRCLYTSMSTPQGAERVIYPHTIIRLGHRWHTRAWCATRGDFRDFNLGRIRAISWEGSPAPHSANVDADWNKIVPVRIRPHRDLTSMQAEVIRSEYFPRTSQRRIDIRGALVPYLIQALRIAVDPVRDRPPFFQLEAVEVAAIKPYLFPD